jgi:hypothetical protein
MFMTTSTVSAIVSPVGRSHAGDSGLYEIR